jgi:hypothetical protein
MDVKILTSNFHVIVFYYCPKRFVTTGEKLTTSCMEYGFTLMTAIVSFELDQ